MLLRSDSTPTPPHPPPPPILLVPHFVSLENWYINGSIKPKLKKVTKLCKILQGHNKSCKIGARKGPFYMHPKNRARLGKNFATIVQVN